MNESALKHPGRVLAERFLAPLGLSSSELARALSVDDGLIARLLGGEGVITTDLALRLGVFLDVPAVWWLEMQALFDVESAPDRDHISKEVQAFHELDNFVITRREARPLVRHGEPHSHVELLSVSSELLARLRAQAKLSAPRTSREVVEVTFDNGAQALVGRTE